MATCYLNQLRATAAVFGFGETALEAMVHRAGAALDRRRSIAACAPPEAPTAAVIGVPCSGRHLLQWSASPAPQTGDTGAGGWFVDFCSIAAPALADGGGGGEAHKVRSALADRRLRDADLLIAVEPHAAAAPAVGSPQAVTVNVYRSPPIASECPWPEPRSSKSD